MRIWIDGQAFQSPSRFRGIGRYILELLTTIKRNYPTTVLQMSFNAAMPTDVPIARTIVGKIIPEDNIFLWEGLRVDGEGVEGYTDDIKFCENLLAYHVACLKPDIALSASPFEGGNNHSVPLTAAHGQEFPIVGVFYDAIPYRYPELYLNNELAWQYYKRRLLCHQNFDLNLSISDFAHDEVISIVEGAQSVPIYAGLSQNFLSISEGKVDKELVRNMGLKGEFLLYVGELDWRKNYLLIADALTKTKSKKAEGISLVVAGGKYQPGILKLKEVWISNGLNPENLIFTGHVSDEELIALYNSAAVLIQPSLMEGFGLTALEGASCGAPVLVANAGALPEVINCPEALFDPNSSTELAALIDRVLTDGGFRKFLKTNYQSSLSRFTWDKTSELAMNAMKTVVKKHSSIESLGKSALDILESNVSGLDLPRSLVCNGVARSKPLKIENRQDIFVDVSSTANIEHGTGIQRVVKSIASNLLELEGPESFSLMSCMTHQGFKPATFGKRGNIKANKRSRRTFDLTRAKSLLMLDGSWDYLDLHFPLLHDYYLRGGKIYFVLYDLVPFRAPAFCLEGVPKFYNEWLKKALEVADGIICISKAVADNLILALEGMNYSRELKIGFWPLGADFSKSSELSKSDIEYNVTDCDLDHFLMVGTIEPRKGYDFALDAFSELWSKGHQCNLTIIGKKGWSSESTVKRISNHPEIDKRLFWLSDASDDQLVKEFKKSSALVSTSYIEGFGLPIVESAYFSCPAIVPDIPVFREVSKSNSTIFFNPETPSHLANVVEKFCEDGLGSRLSTKFVENPPVTWKQSARALTEHLTHDDWYYKYTPPSKLKNVSHLMDINDTQRLSNEQLSFELRQLSKPEPSPDPRFYKCIVRVTNLSEIAVSSIGPAGNEHLGVFLGARIEEEDGSLKDFAGNRTAIPLTMVPGLPYYLSMNLEKEAFHKNKTFKIQMLQESHAWFEDFLLVSAQ